MLKKDKKNYASFAYNKIINRSFIILPLHILIGILMYKEECF